MIEAISQRSKSTSGYDFVKWARNYIKNSSQQPIAEISLDGATKYDVVAFVDGDFKLDIAVSPSEETVWLTQSEIAQAFKITKDNVKQIIKRVRESTKNSPVGDNLSPTEIQIDVVGADAKTYKTKAYNLDMIEAISQRSKSTSGYDFVKWARNYFKNSSQQPIAEISLDGVTKYDVVAFVDGDFKLDVTISPSEETVWLTQDDIAKLFETTIPNISMHIKNIFDEKEIEKGSVVKKSLITATDGKNYYVTHYNFDMVLAVGYRINGKRGIEFRKWATKILKEYSFKGYVINEKRLEKLNKVIDVQNKMLASALNIDSDELSEVIKTYTNALDLLDDYDHQRLEKPNGNDTIYKLEYTEARKIIDSMKFGNDSTLFGVDRTRIVRHISNIYNEGELDKNSTCAENAHMGTLVVQRYSYKIYNLDMIISI